MVSCIMPTFNRREFAGGAIEQFLRQDLPEKELIIVDDGTDPIQDLVPRHPQIRYIRLAERRSLGSKRNLACYEARGELIAHWDDDDWHAPWRLQYQSTQFLGSSADLCGLAKVWFYDPSARQAWQYIYDDESRPWVCGGTLLFRKKFWAEKPFAEVNVGEDTKFVWDNSNPRIITLPNPDFYVARIHGGNTSYKRTTDRRYRAAPVSQVQAVIETALGRAMEAVRIGSLPTETPVSAALEPNIPGFAPRSQGHVSVVIPHAGESRLAQLRATLANVSQAVDLQEIVVIESGERPAARAEATRWSEKYLFVPHRGPFERARSLNLGSLCAEGEYLLWLDNDLLFSSSFIQRAVREMQERRLDYLVPYVHIAYLSEKDSREIMRGTLNPAECAPVNRLYSKDGMCGACALVRREFLERFGGIPEEFRGWGGEDDAWAHKARVLGRTGTSVQTDQILFHLFHPGSGGYGYAAARAQNPHYTANLELLTRIQRVNSAREFLEVFPHRPNPVPAWRTDKPVILMIASSLAEYAQKVIEAFNRIFAQEIMLQVVNAGEGSTRITPMLENASALVLLGVHPDSGRFNSASRIPVIAVASSSGSLQERPTEWRELTAVITDSKGIASEATNSGSIGIRCLQLDNPRSLAVAIAQTLSRVFTEESRCEAKESLPPVWLYWEGPCPEWVRTCHRTIFKHAPTARLLDWESFNSLWDRDRDLDLQLLCVAHRADFVRAFLLARFGGFWIDSDCLLMQYLTPLLKDLARVQFIAHRERSGYISNAFIGAPAGSPVAERFYQTVVSTLRNRRPIGWIELGGEPLTQLLRTEASWRELPCEQIQPICWSKPESFFVLADDHSHSSMLDRNAWCYMLSGQEIQKYTAEHPGSDLLAKGTFFRFLVERSLEEAQPLASAAAIQARSNTPASQEPLREIFSEIYRNNTWQGDETSSGPGSTLEMTWEVRQRLPLLLASLGVRTLLDAPSGDFHWIGHVTLGLDQYIGVDVVPEIVARNRARFAGNGRQFLELDITRDPLPRADLILCRDCFGHLPNDLVLAALRNFKQSAARWLLVTTFTRPRPNTEIKPGAWRPLNLQATPFSLPLPLGLINERCRENQGAYSDKSLGLWDLAEITVSSDSR
jgi:hypothetical protein